MNISMDIWTWVMALCILSIMSFLYKENPVYRLAEHVFVGCTAGHFLGVAVGNIHRFGWVPLNTKGDYHLIIPLLLGVMLYARFIKGYAWVSRWPIAYIVGNGVGLSLYSNLWTSGFQQARATMINILAKRPDGTIWLGRSLNNTIIVLGLMAILAYFIFSIPQRGPVRRVSQAGRWLMMITFGVSFGNVVAGRLNLLIAQLSNLLGKWLGVI
ncbi:MAG: hypothetical protein FD169_680 [Bacillota bacterium]|nr:MAG: hypothetical protein FD169_680 [Bacillota bacterium]MBS3950866.1 hypothetical protein [Peptococcaceae bacterium]